MGILTDTIKRYAEGEMTLEALADFMATFPFVKPARYDNPPTGFEVLNHDTPSYGDEGSWDEVQRAHDTGLLSFEDSQVLTRAVWQAHAPERLA